MNSCSYPNPDLTPTELDVLSAEYDSNHQQISGIELPNSLETCCQKSSIGKKLPNALYVHISAIEKLDPLLRLHYEKFSQIIATGTDGANIIKFHSDRPQISYLFYPDFDTDAHPALRASIQVYLQATDVPPAIGYRNYANFENPPILHRKETFVTPDYPHYEEFDRLTKQEEKLGLLDRTSIIGTRQGWLQWLTKHGIKIKGHRVIYDIEKIEIEVGNHSISHYPIPKIDRHKAAIVRSDISRPVRLALEANIFNENTTFFDYGCGHGGDVSRLQERGYISNGWDPYYFPENLRQTADIVNIGYVINVIENLQERREALKQAWELTGQVLLVSAQVLIDDGKQGQIAYGDGIITNRNTFQKYYEQEELKSYIDQVLGVDSVPVALGIYFVFRDETQAQTFRASRCRSRLSTPKICKPIKKFEDYQELLAPLMAFFTERGRLPVAGELPTAAEIKMEFGRISSAFQVILQATEQKEWDEITEKRRGDLLLYLALGKFSDRPKPRSLAPEVKQDIKTFFGNYNIACQLSDRVLFSLGDLSIIAECCRTSPIGRRRRNALFVHVSALSKLDYRLRIYEGCASRTIGGMDGATLIEFHANKPKISYLFYHDFDTEAHPILSSIMQIDLRDLRVSYRDYENDENPPVLHRKETVLTPDYPGYEMFAKLSRQEEKMGLLDDLKAIEKLQGWQRCLEEHCTIVHEHRLYWRKDADPERLNLMRSAMQAKKQSKKLPEPEA